MPMILITGATGFVGSAVLQRAAAGQHATVAAVRTRDVTMSAADATVCVGDLSVDTSWQDALAGVDVVVHCAARAHVMDDRAAHPLAEFRRVNVDATSNLARQAAHAGVRRFVYLSSIKVNGEQTWSGRPFAADDAPAPAEPYGVSKQEAEDALRRIAAETGLEVVIIRPPLVYGPGVKANFRSMMGWVNKGVPLPLGALRNQRSFVALDNLVDLVLTCVEHPAAADKTFLVSDGEDLSVTELLRRMGRALDRSARLLPVPTCCLMGLASAVGKRDKAQRLCGSLQIDMAATRETLGWRPPVSIDTALQQTADAYRAELLAGDAMATDARS